MSVHGPEPRAHGLLHLVPPAGARAGAHHALRDADQRVAHRVLPGLHAEDHGGHPRAAAVDLHERAPSVGAREEGEA